MTELPSRCFEEDNCLVTIESIEDISIPSNSSVGAPLTLLIDDGEMFMISAEMQYSLAKYVRNNWTIHDRKGRGPGEGLAYFALSLNHDDNTIHVVDSGNNKALVFDRDLNLLDEYDLPVRGAQDGFIILPTGERIISSMGPVGPRSKLLHVISADDILERSFLLPKAGHGGHIVKLAGVGSSPNHLWIAWWRTADMELWNVDSGELIRSLPGRRDWFGPLYEPIEGNETQRRPLRRAPPALRDIVYDNGNLWRLIQISDPKWDGVATALSNRVDTVVEVVDGGTGAILASRRFDDFYIGFGAPGIIYVHEIGENGSLTLRVVSLQLNEEV